MSAVATVLDEPLPPEPCASAVPPGRLLAGDLLRCGMRMDTSAGGSVIGSVVDGPGWDNRCWRRWLTSSWWPSQFSVQGRSNARQGRLAVTRAKIRTVRLASCVSRSLNAISSSNSREVGSSMVVVVVGIVRRWWAPLEPQLSDRIRWCRKEPALPLKK